MVRSSDMYVFMIAEVAKRIIITMNKLEQT